MKGIGYSALVYPRGSIVILGCKSPSSLMNARTEITFKLQCITTKEPEIKNIVFSGTFGKRVNMNKSFSNLNETDGFIGQYEIEIFPVLLCIWKGQETGNGKIQIFPTGKLIVTGVKSLTGANCLLEKTIPYIEFCSNKQ